MRRRSVSKCKGVGEDAQTRVDARVDTRVEEWYAGTLLTRKRRDGAAAGAKETYGDTGVLEWLVLMVLMECW